MKFIEGKKEASPYPDIARQQADIQRQMKGGELRKEFGQRPETKYYKELNPRFATLEKAMDASRTQDNKVAVDQAIINMYNKMMDPDSVVRESEYARTTEDLALWNRLKGKIEKWKSGGPGLTQDDREAIFKMAKEFKLVAEQKYQDTHSEYTGYVKQIGLDPNIYMEPLKGKKKEKNAPNSNYPPMTNTLPKGAKTGKFNGEPAYTTDGKTFFHALTNKRLN